jgi:hypothetical protein
MNFTCCGIIAGNGEKRSENFCTEAGNEEVEEGDTLDV